MRMEFGVSLKLLWHVLSSQQRLLAILVLGRVVPDTVTVKLRLFKYFTRVKSLFRNIYAYEFLTPSSL